jgi:hypothetical protein
MHNQIEILINEKDEKYRKLLLKSNTLVHFIIRIMTDEEECQEIEIKKNSKKIEEFYFEPLVERIFEIHGINNYKIEINFFDNLDSLMLLEFIVFIMKQVYKINAELINGDDLKILVNDSVIYRTNIINKDILK